MKNAFSTRLSCSLTFLKRVCDMPGMREWRKAWNRTIKRQESKNLRKHLDSLDY